MKDISRIATHILAKCEGYDVILFEGEMGAGKTTLIKAVCWQLGVDDNVSSPTFGIVNEYHSISKGSVYHFDFYRFDNEEEALSIGVDDYFYSGHPCLVEWSSKIPSFIPDKYAVIEIQVVDEVNRSLQVVCYG